jgi:SAM-dependent methyltransferase
MAAKRTISPQQKDAEYPGRELESMAFASNYRSWIMDLMKPFLGRHILEVGAGSGSFSELLLQTRPETLTVLEPSRNLFPLVCKSLHAIDPGGVASVRQCTLSEAFRDTEPPPRPDTAVYINVLEHIENDKEELEEVCAVLSPGGRILIFVPAHPWLMGRMDHELGHFRRYTLNELRSKCSSAGFNIELAQYFDILGILPWWLKYRLLNSNRIEPGAVRFHDRWIVPISRILESFLTPPLGKNIILVAEKNHVDL